MFNIEPEFDQYFYQQFKGRRQSAWVLLLVFLTIVVFEIIRFRDTEDLVRLVYLSCTFLLFLLIATLFSIFAYLKLTHVITAYSYEQSSDNWHFTTYLKTIIVPANDVIESQGELSYINTRFKSKLFIIKGEKLYFPIEKLK